MTYSEGECLISVAVWELVEVDAISSSHAIELATGNESALVISTRDCNCLLFFGGLEVVEIGKSAEVVRR